MRCILTPSLEKLIENKKQFWKCWAFICVTDTFCRVCWKQKLQTFFLNRIYRAPHCMKSIIKETNFWALGYVSLFTHSSQLFKRFDIIVMRYNFETRRSCDECVSRDTQPGAQKLLHCVTDTGVFVVNCIFFVNFSCCYYHGFYCTWCMGTQTGSFKHTIIVWEHKQVVLNIQS